MREHRITAQVIELALERHFDSRDNFMLPNLSWGFGLNYEIDLVVVSKALYLYEVEIKISAGDLKRDAKKYKWNYCMSEHLFKQSYFAMPAEMRDYAELVPAHAGILLVSYDPKRFCFKTEKFRNAPIDNAARKITIKEYADLGRLAMLRMWNEKRARYHQAPIALDEEE